MSSRRPPALRPNFDRLARPYRWLEYLTLGRALERCRLHFLPHLSDRRRALVLGDGDGRFLAHLLASNPHLHADAVDLSPAMLAQLRRRAQPSAARLTLYQTDALTFHSPGLYDLVVTHFFLDCLTDVDLAQLTHRLAPHLRPGALWLLSDFRIPSGPLRLPAQLFVRLLYLAFRLITGLRVSRLPDHATALRRAGLSPLAQHLSVFGILTTELWQHHPPTPPDIQPGYILGDPMTTPSPVAPLPPIPGTDLPTSPAYDPIPNPEPPSPSLPGTPEPGPFQE